MLEIAGVAMWLWRKEYVWRRRNHRFRVNGQIGCVRKFNNRRSIVAFSGIDLVMNESGTYNRASNPSSKRGSPHLRKTLFQIVSTYLRKMPTRRACLPIS